MRSQELLPAQRNLERSKPLSATPLQKLKLSRPTTVFVCRVFLVIPLWDTLLGKTNLLQFHEDSQAMIQICKNSRNPTMRHLGRTHGISVAYLRDTFTQGRFNLMYENSASMAADIYTKASQTLTNGAWHAN